MRKAKAWCAMPRQLFTAADIRRLALEQKSELLILGPVDIVTPEAVDVARELGVRLVRESPGGSPPAGPAGAPAPPWPFAALLPPLKLVAGGGVVMDPFGEVLAAPEMQVRLKDVATS